jgi:hypothetical protein
MPMNISDAGSPLEHATTGGGASRSMSAPSHVAVLLNHAPFRHWNVALPVVVTLPLAAIVTDCPEGVVPTGSEPVQL